MQTTSGMATKLDEKTELVSGTLIAEDDAGSYLPIGLVSTITEAREFAQGDLRRRRQELERGGSSFSPAVYKVWAQRVDGFTVVAEFETIVI